MNATMSTLAFPDEEATILVPVENEDISKCTLGDGGPLAFNPHACSAQLLALSEGVKVYTVDVNALNTPLSTHLHTRAVNAIGWHTQEPQLFATASLDSHVRLWDLRASYRKKHTQTFTTPLCQ